MSSNNNNVQEDMIAYVGNIGIVELSYLGHRKMFVS
jgi:hypothetical protein